MLDYSKMQPLRLLPGAGVAAIAALLASPLFGQSSNFDLVNIVNGPPTFSGISLLAGVNGYTYAVGVTNSPGAFVTTAGALHVQASLAAVFIQKLAPDGTVAASALVAQAFAFEGNFAAASDSSGNVYLAVAAQTIAGVSNWNGNSNGNAGIVKVSPQLDQVLYATHIFGYYDTGVFSVAIDSGGSAVVVQGDYFNVQLVKVDASGSPTSVSYTFTDSGPGYDGRWVGVAIGPDHSIFVGASPTYLYRIDPTATQMLYRVAVTPGPSSVELTGLCVDFSGNAYLSATASDPLPIAATPLDYVTIDPQPHGLVLKFNPSGTDVYSVVLATLSVTALATDGTGTVWAAGGSSFGIALFQINGAGTAYLHYLTVPAWDATVSGLNIDSTGRPMLAGTTSSLQIPDPEPQTDVSSDAFGGDLNAFFLRLKSNPAEAKTTLTVTALDAAVPTFGMATFQATVTNAGPAPTDVRIAIPYFPSSTLSLNELLFNCQTTGNGACSKNGAVWRIAYPSLAPGQTQTVQFQLSIPSPAASPFGVSLSALTSTDDPNQLTHNAYASVPIQTEYFDIGTSLPYLTVNLDGSDSTWIIGSLSPATRAFGLQGVPVVPGSSVRVYVPTPQAEPDGMYAFVSWSDGSTDNPRVFSAAALQTPVAVVTRQILEPWVNPDAAVQQAASYRNGAVAPGEVVVLFGFNLGPQTLQQAALDATGHIATTVAGFQVQFDGTPAPIVYTSATQSSVIVPYSVAAKQSTQMTITYNGLNSTPVSVPVADSVPGLLTVNFSGSGQLVAFNSDNSLNSRTNPIARGDIVVLYGSGEGLTSPVPADGTINGASPPQPVLPVSATIGGQSAQVIYAGGVDGVTAGLLQLNLLVPTNIPAGVLPVILTVGTNSSQREATIAVR